MKLNSFARFFGIRGNKNTKKPHRRRTARPKVETLEDRTLLSVIPPATVTNQRILDGSAGLSSLYPNVAVDPMDPQKIIEFHTTSLMSQPAPTDPEMLLNGNYSTDGGKSWFTMPTLFPMTDPATPSNNGVTLAPFAQMSSLNVAWDKMGNAYLVMSEHSTDGTSGKLVLEAYSFSGSAPVQTITDSVIYSWRGSTNAQARQDIAFNPVIAIDNNTPVFIDPDSTAVQPGLPPLQQTDTLANTLSRPDIGPSGIQVPKAFYVAFNINWQSEQGFINAGGAPQIGGVMVVASDDGGRSFTTPEYVTGFSGESGSPQASAPQLVFTQGTTALGFHNNNITTPGGQLSIFYPESPTWNLGNDRTLSQLMVSSSLPDGGSATGAAGVGDTFTGTWGPFSGKITDAASGTGGSIPATTPFSIPVNLADPNFTTLSDVSVTVNLVHPNMDQLRLTLVPPSGSGLPSIPLLLNHDNPGGTTNPGIGLDSGANLGEQTTNVGPIPIKYITPVGTTFSSTIAVRTLRDQTATNQPTGDAHIGYYFPEGGSLTDYFGASKAKLKGTWTLQITDNVNNGTTPPPAYVDNWSIDFTSNMSTTGMGPQVPVPLPTVGVGAPLHGSTTNVYPTALPAAGSPGAGPGYVIAVDNTLGIHSQYAGRMYLAYVGNGPQPDQTAAPKNTDIFLVYSDDGGVTWSNPMTVNDDGNASDGFSSGLRAQFMPSLTVDQATGAVVISYYDTRWDPTQLRSANFLTISIDGGQTFNQSVFLNQASTATNMITGATDVITPTPGNAPQTNPALNFGFGDRQALVAWDGHVYDFFTSNINERFNLTSVSPDFIPLNYTGTEVMTADVTYNAGPRIIAGDEGPVTLTSTYAGEPTPVFASDGRRELSGFSVTFDRPVFIPSFTPDQVSVLFRSPTTALSQPGTPVAVGAIIPVHPDWSGQMASTFFIQLLNPQSAPGTYSYTVGPQISDRVWSARFDNNNATNLAVNGSFELPSNDPGTSQTYASIPGWFLASGPNFDVQNNTYGPAADGNQWLELGDSAGRRAVYQDIPTVAGQTYQISFWFSPAPGTAQSANDMAVLWNGSQVANVSADGTTLTTTGWQQYVYTLKATGPTTRLEFVGLGGTAFGNTELDGVNVVPVSTNPMDQNSNGLAGETNFDQFSMPQPINGVPFQLPYNTATEPLIIPGPYVRVQTTNPQTSGSYVAGQATTTTDNVVMNSTASSVNVRFDRQMTPATFTPAAILRMTGPLGTITGPFTITPVYAKLGDTTTDTFQIGFPKQTLSGQYTITLAPIMKDTAGNLVDTNQNAGLYALNGSDPTSLALSTSTYQINNLSVPIPAGKTVTTPISVADAFKIVQNANNPIQVQLSITDTNDPDLSAQLIAPDGTVIQLFTNVGGLGSPTHANFSSTTFSDFAKTPIQLGTPPFDTGPYNPQKPLSALLGKGSAGKWTLSITNSGNSTGTLTSWAISLPRIVPGTGMGEPITDQFTVGFRIFVQDPTNNLTTKEWVQIGPASENAAPGSNNGQNSSRVSGLAVDPSDPSGNTVYAAGASGGVWKTTNFLTTSPNGPTWQLLTAFGPTTSLNVGSIAVFGRNNDPKQSIVFAATGEGNTTTGGVGLLRSMDGGQTWQVLDSHINFDSQGNALPMSSPVRDHVFSGDSAYKVVVDPTPLPNGQAVVYAAFSNAAEFGGTTGGLWRSVDSGQTWQQIQGGNADDVVLAPASKDANGNAQILYAHFTSTTGTSAPGIYFTSSATTTTILNKIAGQQGVLIRRDDDSNPFDSRVIPVANDGINPSSFTGRAVLSVPALTGNPLQDTLYEGWLYAAVANADGSFNGLYMTKDFGANWTKVSLGFNTQTIGTIPVFTPDNSNTATQYDVTGTQGAYDLTVTVDPNNPHVVYIGGQDFGSVLALAPDGRFEQGGMIRVDTTAVLDPYNLTGYSNTRNDGGTTMANQANWTNGGISIKPDPVRTNPQLPLPDGAWGMNVYNSLFNDFGPFGPSAPYLDLLRDPANPFLVPSTQHFTGVTQFNNNGLGATWTYYTDILDGTTDQHALLAMKDPTTGLTRLLIGDDQGVFSGVDDGTGQLFQGASNALEPELSRNGNLAIVQQYGSAAQPSVLAADIAGSLFYGMAQDDGFPASGSNILTTGNLTWNGTPGDGTAVATDQTGSGVVYQFRWPCCINTPPLVASDFFEVKFPNEPIFGRTSGLLQPGDNPFTNTGQWAIATQAMAGDAGMIVGNFAVNPIDPSGVVMSSDSGNIFRTSGPTTGFGQQWFQIGFQGDLDNSYAYAMAFGAPDPTAGPNNLNDFIYAGTVTGNVFVTFTGGGNQGGHAWKKIGSTANGLDGSPIMQIVTNPKRGSHDAFAVTQQGVYYLPDSTVANPTWIKLNDTTGKGSIFNLTRGVWNNPKDQFPTLTGKNGQVFTSIAVDWRFAIPNKSGTGPATVPVLYVGGFGGVYRSFDFGQTWEYYPDVKTDGAGQDGGYLPNTDITHLSLSLGNINPTTGQPDMSSGLNMLVASTYGNSTYAIRLNNSPFAQFLVIPNTAPQVTGVSPVTSNQGLTLTGLQVTFSGPVDPVTVGLNDIQLLAGPTGAAVAVKDIVDVTVTNSDGTNPHNVWRIDFVNPTNVSGNYHLILGPVISDYSGNQMSKAFDGFVKFFSNRPPVITQPLAQVILPGGKSAPIAFAVNDPDTGPTSVTVTATSSNEALIGDGQTVGGITFPNDISITGTGANRVIVITPTAGLHGSAIITLTAVDPQGWAVTQTFTVYVDNIPALAGIPDPAAIHDGKSVSVPLPAATDADGDTVSFRNASGTPLAFVSGYNPAYDLQQQLDLFEYFGPSGRTYFQSAQWGNGKWLFSAVNGGRYLVMPTGQVLQFVTGAKTVADLRPVASLDPSVWVDPTLITNAQAPVAPSNVTITVNTNTNVLQVRPAAGYVGTFRVTLAATDSILPTPDGSLTADFLQANPFVPHESFLVSVTDSRPTLDPLPDKTMPHGQGSFTVALKANDTDTGDTVSFPDNGLTVSGYSPAYDLQQQLKLFEFVGSTGPTYFQSAQWGNGKWVFSAVDGNRYLIMPTGQVLQYVTGATSPADLTPFASLDPSVWTNPVLLTSAPAPLAPTGIGLSVTGSTLKVTVPTSYTGTFRVTVTASDGALNTAQSFLVNVTDDRPLLAAIPDHTIPSGKSTITVPLSVTDTNGDSPALSAKIVGSSPANDLQQLLGLYEYQSPTGATFFQSSQWGNGKWLFSAFNGNRYLVMPSGQVLQFVAGATSPAGLPMVAQLDPAVWTNPKLLTNPTVPAVVGPTVQITGSTLTVNLNGYSDPGPFRVVVTANDGAQSSTQSFLVNLSAADDTPVLGALGDRSFDHTQTIPTIALNVNDNDQTPMVLQAQTARPGPAYDLQQMLGLYAYQKVGGPNYFQSAQFGNGKWLFSAINGGRYIILPTGEVKAYVTGATNVSQLTHVAQLDPSVYVDPTLISGPTALPIGTAVTNTTLALTPNASVTGSFWTTVLATDGIHLTEQHFLTTLSNTAPLVGGVPTSGTVPSNLPDLTTTTGGGPLTVQLADKDADGDPVKLEVRLGTPGAGTATIDSSNVLTIAPVPTFVGTFTVYITATDGLATTVESFTVTATSAGPWLGTLANQTSTPTQSIPPITLDFGDASGNPVTMQVSTYSYNPAVNLQHQLGLYALQGTTGPNYLVVPQWGNGKWLWSATNGQRYFILPDGELRQWAPGETTVAQTKLVASLDPSFYANPMLLTLPPALPVVTNVIGNTLTVTPASTFVGAFWVDVTISDGLRWTEQRFLVNATT